MSHPPKTTVLACLALAASVAAPAQQPPAAAPATLTIPELRDPTADPQVRLYDVPGLSGEAATMSLRDVVLTTLAYNLDLQSTGINRDIAAEQVFAELGFYDPLFASEFGYAYTDEQAAPGSRATNTSSRWQTTASLTQRTGFGSAVFVEAADIKTDREPSVGLVPASPVTGTFQSENTYNSRVTFGIRQPLLRGFGRDTNNLALRVSKRELEIANHALRLELQRRVGEVMSGYWELVFALQQLDVDLQSLESARELERVQAARVQVGQIPRLELVQAEAQVAQREFLVASSQAAVIAAQDRLLQLMNWNREAGARAWNRPILPADMPTLLDDLAVDDQEMILFAQDFRPDYKIAQVNREIAELRQRAARRDLLPQLDAFAQYTTTGLEESRGDAVDTLFTDYNGWSTGLTLTYPLFNRRARGLHAQSLDRMEQAEIALDNTELLITTEVRSATRALRTTRTQVEAARRNVQSELERVRAERQRLEVGDRTVFNVLDALDDLVEAQSNLVRALADFQIALIDLGRSTGTILWAQGIEVDDQEAPGIFTLSFEPRASSRATTGNPMAWGELVRSAPNIRSGADPNPNPVPAPEREPASPQPSEPVRAPQ